MRPSSRPPTTRPRPYKFILLSDHGQSLGATFLQRYGKSLKDVISELMGGVSVADGTGSVEQWGTLNAALSEAAQADGTTAALTRAAFKGQTEDGTIDVVPAEERADETAGEEPPELVVCASGNLGLIYFPRLDGRVSIETIEETWPGLVETLDPS